MALITLFGLVSLVCIVGIIWARRELHKANLAEQ